MVYAGLIGLAALLVMIPGSPLGLLTMAVQVLAGVLLPSATVFLLLLCNDRAVLGPWVNGHWLNLFPGSVIAVLVVLSVILTAAVLYPTAAMPRSCGHLAAARCWRLWSPAPHYCCGRDPWQTPRSRRRS
jgi:hypothetical protein